jgi:hypothetical protein
VYFQAWALSFERAPERPWLALLVLPLHPQTAATKPSLFCTKTAWFVGCNRPRSPSPSRGICACAHAVNAACCKHYKMKNATYQHAAAVCAAITQHACPRRHAHAGRRPCSWTTQTGTASTANSCMMIPPTHQLTRQHWDSCSKPFHQSCGGTESTGSPAQSR